MHKHTALTHRKVREEARSKEKERNIDASGRKKRTGTGPGRPHHVVHPPVARQLASGRRVSVRGLLLWVKWWWGASGEERQSALWDGDGERREKTKGTGVTMSTKRPEPPIKFLDTVDVQLSASSELPITLSADRVRTSWPPPEVSLPRKKRAPAHALFWRPPPHKRQGAAA